MANDPWKSYRNSRDTLLSSMDERYQRDRTAEIDALHARAANQQFDLGEVQLGRLRQDVADQQALRDLETRLGSETRPVEMPNPALGGAEYAPGAGPLRPTVTQQVSLSPLEKTQARSDLMMSQGRYAEAGQMIDITSKVAEADMRRFAQTRQMLELMGPEYTKAWVAQQGGDANMVDRMKTTPEGHTVIDLPNGGSIMAVDNGQGGHQLFQIAGDKIEQFSDPYEITVDGRTVLVRRNLKTNKVEPVSTGPNPMTGGAGDLGEGDIEGWADAIESGRLNISDAPARGGANSVKAQVVSVLERRRKERGQAPVDYQGNTADNKAFTASLQQQQKQLGAMGSFVRNMSAQIERVKDISKELKTYDTRIMNVPLRAARGMLQGSPLQAKYDMYLTEIESEIGKLATGSSASISELSVSAQEKWAKIHDKNLSVKDMLQLLEETKHAGELRMKSVQDQVADTRKRMRDRPAAQAPQGKKVRNPQTGQEGWLQPDGSILDASGRKLN